MPVIQFFMLRFQFREVAGTDRANLGLPDGPRKHKPAVENSAARLGVEAGRV